MPDFADQLLAELDAACWPLAREQHAHDKVRKGIALRKGSADQLQGMAKGWDASREMYCNPLAKRIAVGFADFLFADEVRVEAPDADEETGESDAQGELDAAIEWNRLASSLHRAERRVVSEGELYWKLHVNRTVAPVPLLTWSSRLSVVPLFYGDRLLAAAFVREVAREMGRDEKGVPAPDAQEVVWRHAEVHCDGRVINVLYRGTDSELGVRRPITDRAETAAIAEEWLHGLPMLAGRVVNDLDDDDDLGVSEYDQVEDLLFALNEAITIGVENARLTGQDRVFVAGKFRGVDGSFDASVQVFELDQNQATTLGDSPSNPSIYGVEKHYDAEPLWLHISKLVKTILSSVGLVAQWIGDDVEGQAESGTARRIRFLPTTNAAKGKTREWQDTLPRVMHLMLRVIALAIEQGGFGRGGAPEDPPVVSFTDPLPLDTSETTENVTMAVAAEVMSRRTGVQTIHPDWDDGRVSEEIDEIRKDTVVAPAELPDDPPAPPEPAPEPEPAAA